MSRAERQGLVAQAKAERALRLPSGNSELLHVAFIKDDPRRLRRRIDEEAVAGLVGGAA